MKALLKTKLSLKKIVKKVIFLVFVTFLFQPWVAWAAVPTYIASGTVGAGVAAVIPGLPAGILTNDILLMVIETANQAISIPTPAGGTWTEITSSPQGTGTAAGVASTRLTIFWSRYNGTQTAPTTSDSGDHQRARIYAFRGVILSGNPWDVTYGAVLATASTAVSVPGGTTTATEDLVLAIVANGTDTNTAQCGGTWTNASLTGLIEIAGDNTNAGNGGGTCIASGAKTTAGAFNTTITTILTSSVQGLISLALKPQPTTTLAAGTDPANSTVAPSSAITDLDAFTFASSVGTDSITALTVTLTGVNSFESLSEVRITSDNGATLYFAAAANPLSNTVSFSGGTPIPVSTTATQFKVRITPKTHANMPVPPGLSYAVGGTVTAFTSTNAQLGTDATTPATITVDNLSPGSVTVTSGAPGNAQVVLNWTNPLDADYNSAVVFRRATTAVADVPVEGVTYIVGNTVNTSTVACVIATPTATCTDTGLTNGVVYHYKIFTKDSNGNYDTGVVPIGSPYTPVSVNTSIADGVNPSNVTIGPGAVITDLDAFTLTANSGTDTVTAVTVTLSPAGAFNNIAQVDLTDNTNVAQCTAVTNPASNTISFITGCSLAVTTSASIFKVRITPKSHVNMPAVPGASYATTGTVTAFTNTNAQLGTDGTSATVTVDNLSPNGATVTSVTAGNAANTINWTTSNSADFNTSSGSVVYRWAAASAGAEVPTEGSTVTIGAINGTAIAACVVSSAVSTALSRIDGTGGSATCTTTPLTNGQSYAYKVFQKDTNGNYDLGVSIGASTPTTPLISATGTVTSAVFDAGVSSTYNSIMWSGTSPLNTNVRFQFAGADCANGASNAPTCNSGSWGTAPSNYVGGANCDITSWFAPSGPNVPVELIGSGAPAPTCRTQFNNKRYYRYKVQICSSTDCVTQGTTSPVINKIVVNYSP